MEPSIKLSEQTERLLSALVYLDKAINEATGAIITIYGEKNAEDFLSQFDPIKDELKEYLFTSIGQKTNDFIVGKNESQEITI